MKISLILLAAGNSKRFGENKLLYPINGKPMYQYAAEVVRESEAFFEKVLITQFPSIGSDMTFADYKVVHNNNSELGISHSVVLGVANCREDTDGYCFLVCDQPYLTATSLKAFVEGYVKSKLPLGTMAYGDKLGNPTLFSVVYKDELLSLVGDAGGRKILRNAAEEDVYIHQVGCEKELMDIDTKNGI